MSRRLKQVQITGELLQQMVTTGAQWGGADHVVVCTEGVPEGARLRRTFYDTTQGCIAMVFEHSSFDELLPWQKIPLFAPILSRVEIMDEVCEHGCHNDKTYGLVVMAGCPEHD